MKNIILIGMPGCGKSTVGVVLAKTLGTYFIDTDLIIQVQRKNTLQQLIDTEGLDKFLEYEQEALLSVTEQENTVIATGGSAVFSAKGMTHLKRKGVCVYINLGLDELEARLSNIRTRGIASKNGETLADILAERTPYYERYADIKIDAHGKNPEQIVEEIVKSVEIL